MAPFQETFPLLQTSGLSPPWGAYWVTSQVQDSCWENTSHSPGGACSRTSKIRVLLCFPPAVYVWEATGLLRDSAPSVERV